jgi:hypothetical protein
MRSLISVSLTTKTAIQCFIRPWGDGSNSYSFGLDRDKRAAVWNDIGGILRVIKDRSVNVTGTGQHLTLHQGMILSGEEVRYIGESVGRQKE